MALATVSASDSLAAPSTSTVTSLVAPSPSAAILRARFSQAQRMAAAPSTEQYSAFSVLCQWLYDVKLSMELAPGNFWPRPKVSSQAVLLTPKQHPARCTMPPLFVKTVHALFSQRRKTLLNNIKPLLPKGSDADSIFRQAGLDKSERAENLGVAQFVALTEALHEAAQSAKP